MRKSNKNIIFTGGHATATAYALIQYIKPLEECWNFFWIGPKSFVEGKNVESLENKVFENLGVKVFTLDAGRLQRKFTIWTIPALLKIPLGFLSAFFLIKKIKPDLVLSFGGFVGFPVVVVAKVLGIPVIVHEQTAAAGRGNLAVSVFANKIAVSRESSFSHFPRNKTVLTGNPIDPEILKVPFKRKMGYPPVLFVTGGHTGSIRINENVLKVLPNLLERYLVIHQTGKLDFSKFKNIKDKLPSKFRTRYQVFQTISSEKWPNTLKKADIVLSRAGANIVSQLLVTKRPAVLVPIPFSYLNEQFENALYAQKFGVAEIIEEDSITPEVLLKKLNMIYDSWPKIISRIENKKSPDEQATYNLYSLIKRFL